MKRDRPFDTLSYANALRKRLGLSPAASRNAGSDTARELVRDVPSGYSHFERLVELLRDPPRGVKRATVREFLGHVYEWADFVWAACGAFDDAVQKERYGDGSASGLVRAAHNIARELFCGAGVRLMGMKVDPEAFRAAARAWSPAQAADAQAAVTKARQELRRVVLADMARYLPGAPESPARSMLSQPADRLRTYLRTRSSRPTYDDIAAELQMGRTTISKALTELRNLGILQDATGEHEAGPN